MFLHRFGASQVWSFRSPVAADYGSYCYIGAVLQSSSLSSLFPAETGWLFVLLGIAKFKSCPAVYFPFLTAF